MKAAALSIENLPPHPEKFAISSCIAPFDTQKKVYTIQSRQELNSVIREIYDAGLKTKIQADGNINQDTIPRAVKAGADILTGGTSGLFLKGKTVKQCCEDMLKAAEEAKGVKNYGINE